MVVCVLEEVPHDIVAAAKLGSGSMEGEALMVKFCGWSLPQLAENHMTALDGGDAQHKPETMPLQQLDKAHGKERGVSIFFLQLTTGRT